MMQILYSLCPGGTTTLVLANPGLESFPVSHEDVLSAIPDLLGKISVFSRLVWLHDVSPMLQKKNLHDPSACTSQEIPGNWN